MRWVALLRGINVGRTNRLPMADLRTTLEALGATRVITYVQSGNAVFDHDGDHEPELAASITDAIERRHALVVPVVLRPAAELVDLADHHPEAGSDIDPTLLHVVFFDVAPSIDAVASIDFERFAPDRFLVDGRHAFVTYPNGSARSRLTLDVLERATGVTGTARNLRSVRRIAELAASGTDSKKF